MHCSCNEWQSVHIDSLLLEDVCIKELACESHIFLAARLPNAEQDAYTSSIGKNDKVNLADRS